ncbi:TPA: hypothetical protein N0F65_007574 [Lagenidium giganteum]|uniref:PH domain-containing protein n=1 Tax=Lagenidium giganteum TaxID=4803 RepID=A0AAV2ZN91_9STRA|nr:TPA: hypothetical protein N0F65_007574 [Lagenidium giganteum]
MAQAMPRTNAIPRMHGWDWAHTTLYNEQPDKRCVVNMVDTLIFSSERTGPTTSNNANALVSKVLWLFTQKNGTVAKKKESNQPVLNIAAIRDRFIRLACRTSRPSVMSEPSYLAFVYLQNGTRQLVTAAEFQEWLDAIDPHKTRSPVRASRAASLLGFQAYLRSFGDQQHFILAQYEAPNAPDRDPVVIDIHRVEGQYYVPDQGGKGQRLSDVSPRLRKEVEATTKQLVDCLARSASVDVLAGTFEFVVDDEQKLWLTHIAHVETREASKTPRSVSLPSLPSATMDAKDTSNGANGAIKCRGEFCRAAPSSLPGLYPPQPEQELDTSDRADDDRSSAENNAAATQLDMPLPDNGQRFKIANNNILLARAELDFLVGNIRGITDDRALSLKWQEADNVLRMELGRANPSQFYKQIGVCANCHRIYTQLQKCRDQGFPVRTMRAQAAWPAQQPQQQQSEHNKESTKKQRKHANVDVGSSAPESHHADIGSTQSDEYYDQLFLAELSKHSTGGEPSSPTNLSTTRSRNERGSPSNKSHHGTLPSLTSSVKSSIVPTKPSKALRSPRLTDNNEDQDGGHASTAVTRKLEQKVAQLEAELAATRDKLSATQTQRSALEQRLLQTQAQCTKVLQEKDEQTRKQLLELELEFHSKKQQPGAGTSNSGSAAEEMAKLIESMDSLHFQLDQAKHDKEAMRLLLNHAHQNEVKRLHDKYQSEMEALRLSEHTAKERGEQLMIQLANAQSQGQTLVLQAKSAKQALDDVMKTKVATLEEANLRLERQVLELKAQKSAQTTTSGDMKAMEKHLNNKIEYLKAQLASEMKCKEEMGNHLAQVTNAMDALKKEKKQALLEQEETFKRQQERAEAQAAQEKEVYDSQHAAFQAKIVTLQANVTDLVQELTLWKTKESNLKLAMEKAAEENVRLTRQLVEVEGQLEVLQEERKNNERMSGKNATDETNRLQMEALLRRLDNERQYLKSQLESEMEMKDKSQAKASALEEALRDSQLEAEEIEKRLGHELGALRATHTQEMTLLRDAKLIVEEEKATIARQLQDAQRKAAQAREQALLDRDDLEKARHEMTDMRAQLIAAKEETVKEKEYTRQAHERMSSALAALKNSLKAMEEEKNLRIHRLEEENGLYLSKLANAQAEMLVQDDKWALERIGLQKEMALVRLAIVVFEKARQWGASHQRRAFARWTTHTVTRQVVQTTTRTHERAMMELEQRLTQDYADKLDHTTQLLHDERVRALNDQARAHARETEELRLYEQQERAQLEEVLSALHAKHVAHMQQSSTTAAQDMERKLQQTVRDLQESLRIQKVENENATAAFQEARQRCEDLGVAMNAQLERVTAEWLEKEKQWQAERTALMTEARNKQAQAVITLKEELAKREKTFEDKLEKFRQQMVHEENARRAESEEQAAADKDSALQAQVAGFVEQIAAIKLEHQAQLSNELAAVTARWQHELTEERQRHERALRDALERVEAKAQTQLDTMQKEMNDRKGNALVQCTAKWQRAMEELQERMDVDKRAAYAQGVQDREQEWQQAAGQIKLKQKEELDAVQKEAVLAIQAAEERFKLRLETQVQQMRVEFQSKQKEELEVARQQLEREIQAKAQTSIDEHVSVVRQELQAQQQLEQREFMVQRHAEMERLRHELSEKFESDKSEWLQTLEEKQEDEIEALEMQWKDKLERLEEAKAQDLQAALVQAQAQAEAHWQQQEEAIRAELAAEIENQLKEQETRLLGEQEEAITQVQEDSEKLIEQVEAAMTELKKQKESMEHEVAKLRQSLEEAEDSQFDIEETLKKQRKHMTFQFLALLMQSRRKVAEHDQKTQALRAECQATIDMQAAAASREKQQWQQSVIQIQQTWTQLQDKHDEMLKTLTQYKRDELVAHRSASAVLSNEISIVQKQMNEVNEMKATLEKEIDALQAEAQAVEANLRQLMLPTPSSFASSSSSSSSGSTTTSDGALNMAVIAKKRRLNEEFEHLLEQMEKKKLEVRNTDKTLVALRQRREEKEEELKAMERKLVEILVQQQKQMLSLLTTTRDLALYVPALAPGGVLNGVA